MSIQTYHHNCPGIVGKPFFETAKKTLEGQEESERRTKWIEHCDTHLRDLDTHRHIHAGAPNPDHQIVLRAVYAKVEEVNIVYTAHNTQPRLVSVVETSKNLARENAGVDSEPSKDDIVNKAYEVTAITLEYYLRIHNININILFGGNKPVPLLSIVHYGGIHGTVKGYDNAYFDGKEMVYGDGHFFNPLVLEPTVGVHEITHGVTQFKAGIKVNGHATGLDYTGDAGGLNEFNSDAGGVSAIQRKNRVVNPKADASGWLIGKGLFADNDKWSLRDMLHPGTAYIDDPNLGTDPQAGYGDYNNWKDDSANTDPHLASATGNLWFANTAIAIYDITNQPTWETVEKIRMAAYPYLPADCTYPQYAAITIDRAKKLFSGQGDRVWQAVQAQWQEVGVIPQ